MANDQRSLHALIPPSEGEPWRCRCGRQYDWSRSEDYPGGITRQEARFAHRYHVAVWRRLDERGVKNPEGVGADA